MIFPNSPESGTKKSVINFIVNGTIYKKEFELLSQLDKGNTYKSEKGLTQEEWLEIYKRDLKDCYDDDTHQKVKDYYYGYN